MNQFLKKMNKEIFNEIPEKMHIETADGAVGRNWEWSEHKYAERSGSPGNYRYDYSQKEKIPEEEEKAKRNIQEQKEKVMVPGKGMQIKKIEDFKPKLSGELQNPHTKESRQASGFESRSPGQKLPSLGKNISPLGMGLHQHNESAWNSMNQNLEHAKVAMKGTQANTMVDQSHQQMNVYSNKEIGIDNMMKQMSIANPYDKQDLQKMNMSHNIAKEEAYKTGGTRYTVSRSKKGLFSICVYPDNSVYDPTLGLRGIPVDIYLQVVPYSLIPT